MCRVILCCVFLLILSTCALVESYRILGLSTMASHSHHTIGTTVLKALAAKGHDVTVVTPYPSKTPIKNYREISIANNVATVDEHRKNLFDLNKVNMLMNIYFVFSMGNSIVEDFFKHPNVQKLLNSNEKFDAVYMEYFLNDAAMGLANHFNAPLIMVSPMPASGWINNLVANPGSPAYIPNLMSTFSSEMTFIERLQNTFYDWADTLGREILYLPAQRKILKKYLPHVPDLMDIRYNTSILLVNSHESINDAVPHVPNMIPIGGYHVAPPKELPADLKTFLDNAKEGVVLFSMGSNLNSKDLPLEIRSQILRAFSKIKQKVLWKFEEDIKDKPANVKIQKWLPQQDILAHPNVKAFITHGGLLSTIETVYFGKPVIGIPVFGDQSMNVQHAVDAGYAVSIPLKDLGEQTLSKALDEILNNPKYTKEVQRRSAIMHDRPVKPLDAAVYWVEYAIRHKGAAHLRSSALKLTWYQREQLDVYGAIAAVVLGSLYLLKALVCKICSKKKKTPASVGKSKKNK